MRRNALPGVQGMPISFEVLPGSGPTIAAERLTGETKEMRCRSITQGYHLFNPTRQHADGRRSPRLSLFC